MHPRNGKDMGKTGILVHLSHLFGKPPFLREEHCFKNPGFRLRKHLFIHLLYLLFYFPERGGHTLFFIQKPHGFCRATRAYPLRFIITVFIKLTRIIPPRQYAPLSLRPNNASRGIKLPRRQIDQYFLPPHLWRAFHIVKAYHHAPGIFPLRAGNHPAAQGTFLCFLHIPLKRSFRHRPLYKQEPCHKKKGGKEYKPVGLYYFFQHHNKFFK